MKRKTFGTSLIAVGLFGASFLAGGLLLNAGGSGAASPQALSPGGIATPTEVPAATATATMGSQPAFSAGNTSIEAAGSASGPAGGNGVLTPSTAAEAATPAITPQAPLPVPVEPETAVEEPPVEAPAVEEPPVEAPAVEEPQAEAPAVEEPAEPPPPAPVAVNDPPFVQTVVPQNGATGVKVDTTIQVMFSEAMDKASVEAAFSIQPAVTGTFSWDAEGRQMTFKPDAPFPYNTQVKWNIADSAQDESGLGMLESAGGGFQLLRQKTINLYSQAARDGHVFAPPVAALQHVVANKNDFRVGTWSRGFLSFDLSKLPAKTVEIVSAELRVHQRDQHDGAYGAATGGLYAVSVAYGDLDIGDFSAKAVEVCLPLCAPASALLTGAPGNGWKSTDVTLFVRNDWKAGMGNGAPALIEAASAMERLSQFRLQFDKENAGAGPDVWAEFHAGESATMAPVLRVTFVYP